MKPMAMDPAEARKAVEAAIANGWATKPGRYLTNEEIDRLKQRAAVDKYQEAKPQLGRRTNEQRAINITQIVRMKYSEIYEAVYGESAHNVEALD